MQSDHISDYLIVGSGLSALTFGALMANTGKTVQVVEAHEHPGGFGHTFTMAQKYTFNAQFHYVWDCGEGQTVDRVLKKLGLSQAVTFERYDPDGFDHMRMPGYALDMPSDPEVLIQRLVALFPEHHRSIRQFVDEVEKREPESNASHRQLTRSSYSNILSKSSRRLHI
jgi:all-trans-retinol 13,14-reductase